jgi:hypothetical protein
MTPFCFEHVFRAASVADVFAAYFDPGHQREQDDQADLLERTVLEIVDTETDLRRVCRVVPRRQLPGFVRALMRGPLHYTETVRWRKASDEIDIEVLPSVLGGRAKITALYRLAAVGPGAIHRHYGGFAHVDVAMVSARIERGIVAEFEKSLPAAAACTQAWLDRPFRSVSART